MNMHKLFVLVKNMLGECTNMKSLKQIFSKLFVDNEEEYLFLLSKEKNKNENEREDEEDNKEVYPSLNVNLEYINLRFNSLINSDIKIREFIINVKKRNYKAFIIYVDGMVNSDSINEFVLKPLMLKNISNQSREQQVISEAIADNITIRHVKKFKIEDYILECLIPQNDISLVTSFNKIASDVVSGNCVLFIDTINYAFDIAVKKYEKRSIAEPKNEQVIKGSQEAFVEDLRTNTSMIRRNLNNEKLVIENLCVGKTDKNNCAICYMKNIANSSLVAEVKFRLNNLDVDYISSIGELEQLIQDNVNTTLPQTISTERVDNIVNYLLQGRVAIIYNGVPYVIALPVTFFDFLSSPEDKNINNIFANALKLIRIFATFITLLLPSLYIAITTFHRELIPTELLFSIVSSRGEVPFAVIVEIILMEISFEIIREAGLRVPTALGSTVGIVGALILGQAAVEAKIVSPILVILIAITGITSFIIPDNSLSLHLRLYRFLYTLIGSTCGFFGIAIGIVIHITVLCSLHSFGVSYLAPYIPFQKTKYNGFFLLPAWRREKRYNFLQTQKDNIQSKISMKWRYLSGKRKNK